MPRYKIGDILPQIREEAMAQGVDPELAIAHLVAENTGSGQLNPNQEVDTTTRSPTGAMGIFQVVGKTLAGLAQEGYIPKGLNYNTLEGQVKAGIAAIRESQDLAARRGAKDPMAGAAQYVNGNAGYRGFMGLGPMPEQARGYLKKIQTYLNSNGMEQVASAQRYPATIPTSASAAMPPETAAGAPARMADGGLATAQAAAAKAETEYNRVFGQFVDLLGAMGIKREAAVGTTQDAIRGGATSGAEAARATAQRELDKVDTQNRIADLMGVNVNGNSSALIDLLSQQQQYTATAQDLKPQVDQLMAINPLANPVKWIAAQFQLGSLVPQYNAAIQNKDITNNRIAKAAEITNNLEAITPAVKVSTINDELNAKQRGIAAKAAAEVARLDIENYDYQVQTMANIVRYTEGTANFASRAVRDMISIRGQDAMLEEHAANREMKKEVKDAQAAQLAQAQATAAMYGGTPPLTWAALRALPKDVQELYINSGGIAGSPGEAITNIIKLNGFGKLNSDPNSKAMSALAQHIVETSTPEIKAALALNPKADYEETVRKVVNEKYSQWKTEWLRGDATAMSSNNPYRADIKAYASAKALANNPLAVWVNDPANPIPKPTERDIYAKGMAMIESGTPVDLVAQATADFFAEGNKHQYIKTGMGVLGFDPNTVTGMPQYKITSNIFGFTERLFSGMPSVPDKGVDAMNATDNKYFYTMATIKKMQRSGVMPIGPSAQDIQAELGIGQ